MRLMGPGRAVMCCGKRVRLQSAGSHLRVYSINTAGFLVKSLARRLFCCVVREQDPALPSRARASKPPLPPRPFDFALRCLFGYLALGCRLGGPYRRFSWLYGGFKLGDTLCQAHDD